MKKNKFLIFLIISVLIQIHSFAAFQNKIIVKVEGLTISTYELKNKIKTTLILSNEIINQENINTNKDSAINFLINLRLKEQELSNYNIQIDNALLNTQLNLFWHAP